MSEGPGAEVHARVDARQLESALLALRRRIVHAPLLLEAPGVTEARAERGTLLTQIDDYLLPRIRQSAAPVLVALVGSTGAGKSTLVNSIAGARVSQTGIRRPTTNSPVLACHPDEIGWFAENVFLPTLPRVRQQGLAMPGRDGLLVLAGNRGIPRGVALLDTPDIDSVVQAHHEFARQFLDASDLWLFMTTGSRYADAPVWDLLRYAKERDAALGIVLARVQPWSRDELVRHFTAMLERSGLGGAARFLIPETAITEGMLPAAVCGPIRDWLTDAAVREDRRVAVLTQTMSGVLGTFRTRVPALASHVAAQLALRVQLRQSAEECYAAARAGIDEATRNGSLLRGETLARWQDFADRGDLLRILRARRRGSASRPRGQRIPARAQALKAAVGSGLQSLIVSAADRAADEAVSRWRDHPAGAALLEQVPPPIRRRVMRPRPVVRGGRPPFDDEDSPFADSPADPGTAGPAPGAAAPDGSGLPGVIALRRSSPDLARRAARAVSAWQDHVLGLVQAENVTRRSIARVVAFDDESLALVVIIGLLGFGAGDAGQAGETSAVAQDLLGSLLGPGPLRDIGTKARADLRERVRLLFAEEMLRFAELIDAGGVPDEAAAIQLYQATYSLEVVR